MSAIWNIGWLNANAQRNYPLSETASAQDTTESIELPPGLLVDLVLTVPVDRVANPGLFYLSTVAFFATGVTLIFSYDGTPAAAVTFPSGASEYSAHRVSGLNDFTDISGWAVFGQKASVLEVAAGAYEFSNEGGRLEATTIRPDISGVSSLRIYQDGTYSERITGDITLVAGSNARLTLAPVSKEIRFDAIAEALDTNCGCEDPALSLPPITQIGSAFPDSAGKVSIIGDACLQVIAAGNQVTFDDLCSAPCCGCEELEVIRQDQQLVAAQVLQAAQTLSALQAGLTAMRTTLLTKQGK